MNGAQKSETARREPSFAKATDGRGKKSETSLREETTLAFWNERKIFEKSLRKGAPKGLPARQRAQAGEYVFYDGPPFATGLPHYGHIVASVIKDVVPRYWTMRGYRVPRVWGWDCHGLPIENIVEKELGFKHKKDIKEYGIAKFNERCRERVLTYASEWEKIIPRIGRWADMEHAYRTMDKPFMESVWWVFKELWNKGLVYEDYRSMHICPRCETTLSQQEVSEGYKDVKDISVTVKFEMKNPEKHGFPADTCFLVWTTTPWTLPGNVALAVNSNETYRLFEWGTQHYIDIKKQGYSYPGYTLKEFPGKDIVGLEYEPLFDYYANDKTLKNRENGWKVYAADFVTTETGTGIVHIAPAFGEDDMTLGREKNLPFVQHVNMDGTFTPQVTDFPGTEVKPIDDPQATDVQIVKYLAHKGLLFAKEKIEHPYPHCWRCDTPLLNYATGSWFVSVTKLKENLLKNAENINWSPAHIKEGRFGDWLRGARDWSISRQRFWASVIPIWRCGTCKKVRVFGSAAELEEASRKKIDDLHKHIVDEITVPCECGETMKRIPDVLDTWFDSGSMPYGERHYPFAFSTDSKGLTLDPLKVKPWLKTFPAQFIAEGLDQTRAWFYYLHVFAGALFNKNAFQNVIVNGIVLAEDGKKMSKKLNNYPDPMEVVGRYGADALRFYLLSSPVMQAENLSFSEKGVDEVARKNIGRLGNVLAFYQMYANGTSRDSKSQNILDKWILARLDQLVRESTAGYEKYQLDAATRPVVLFIDDLSAWYVRRSRERFKKGGDDAKAALATLRHVLYTLSLVIAPSMPFLAEHVYQAVKEESDPESVHLAEWPLSSRQGFFAGLFGRKENSILKDMANARAIVTQALEARDKAGIKVRQPLASLKVSVHDCVSVTEALKIVIADEVNVRDVVSSDELKSGEIILDTTITPELKEEGGLRDIVRITQVLRKNHKLTPSDRPSALIRTTEEGGLFLNKFKEKIKKSAGLKNIEVVVVQENKVAEAGPGSFSASKPFELEMYLKP